MKILTLIATIAIGTAVFISGCSLESGSGPIRPESGESQNETGPSPDFVSVDDAVKTALKAGDRMPGFVLPNARNEDVDSADLLKESNLVLVFYRGDWCPYCNLYLKRLQDKNDDIKNNGGQLVAISVENPDDSLSVSEKNKLSFTVLSDKNLDLARRFKIVYELPKKTDDKYKTKGIDLVRDNGTEKPELPISATYIVKKDGEISYAFLNPDYKKRLEPDAIIEELRKINTKG